jgi:hypothetical protein
MKTRNLLIWTKIRPYRIRQLFNSSLLRRTILTGLLLLLSALAFSQKILVVENKYSLKNLKYYSGDGIILKVENIEKKISDEILDMTDSSLILNIRGEIMLDHIDAIYRENWLIKILRGFSLMGGVAYFGIDSFNRLINNDSPVILAETAIISAGMVAFSFALIPLNYRKINTREKWALRVIDLNSF